MNEGNPKDTKRKMETKDRLVCQAGAKLDLANVRAGIKRGKMCLTERLIETMHAVL